MVGCSSGWGSAAASGSPADDSVGMHQRSHQRSHGTAFAAHHCRRQKCVQSFKSTPKNQSSSYVGLEQKPRFQPPPQKMPTIILEHYFRARGVRELLLPASVRASGGWRVPGSRRWDLSIADPPASRVPNHTPRIHAPHPRASQQAARSTSAHHPCPAPCARSLASL